MKLPLAAFSAVLAVILAAPVSGRAQMSQDFLPLNVGNSWTYTLSTEAGEAAGGASFAVREYTIVAGRSFYTISEFPFFTAESIRFVRYDRSLRQFMKATSPESEESPLFDPGASVEGVQEDTSGVIQRFVLSSGGVALTFQRGVGIVAARFETPQGARVAKIAASRVGEPETPKTTTVPEPAGVPKATGRPENVAQIGRDNPAIQLEAAPAANGGFKFTLSVTNTSSKLLPVSFSSSQSYDFAVTDTTTGEEMWRWSRGMFFSQVIRTEAMRANGSWKFEVVWDGRDRSVNPVPAGRYRLTAIVASNPPLEAKPTTFQIP